MPRVEVSAVVKAWMERKDLPVREFAAAVNVSHPTILNWSKGETIPGLEWLIWAARTFEDWRREFALDCLEARLGPDAMTALKLRDWIWKKPEE